jgi:hypothetical protein
LDISLFEEERAVEVAPKATEAPLEAEKIAEVATEAPEAPEASTEAEKRVKLKSSDDEMFKVAVAGAEAMVVLLMASGMLPLMRLGQ